MLKIAVVGSRGFQDKALLKTKLDTYKPFVLVSGGAIGADRLAEEYADENKLKKIIHKPEWKKFGRAAGFKRNKLIVQDCDMLIAFWNGKSKGTSYSIFLARQAGKLSEIVLYNKRQKEGEN